MSGVRVVELGVWIAGPAAAGVLCDWGADVIKIEPPDGDPCRLFQKLLGEVLPTNPVFDLDNRGKRSIALDLSTAEGRATAAELISQADVFVTNVRPGALQRAGIDAEAMLSRNSRLVYAQITGYGTEGDDADRPAFDIGAYWSRAGIAGLLRTPDGRLPFQRGGIGDHSTGVQMAGAISAALFHRERTGEGQLVTTSLLRQGIYTIGFDLNLLLGWGACPAISRRETMGNPAINNYTCGDGKQIWLIGLVPTRHWEPLARCVGRTDWLADERFETPVGRAQHAAELIEELDAIFATKSRDEWAELFANEPDMFWAPVNDPDDVIADPQVWASGAFIEVPARDGGTQTMVATPADFGTSRWAAQGPAPEIGEHTEQILAELAIRRHETPARS
jgi:crotonobetainyl-CoA:carnitine CoA-transferase CaiB-like acyl-CoA transferase